MTDLRHALDGSTVARIGRIGQFDLKSEQFYAGCAGFDPFLAGLNVALNAAEQFLGDPAKFHVVDLADKIAEPLVASVVCGKNTLKRLVVDRNRDRAVAMLDLEDIAVFVGSAGIFGLGELDVDRLKTSESCGLRKYALGPWSARRH